MKKNGYLRRFLALFLALVMIMADSSVTTFAATVGRVKQKSAAASRAASNGLEVTVNGPDGTYYVATKTQWGGISSKVAAVTVTGGTATVELEPKQSDQNISNDQIVF